MRHRVGELECVGGEWTGEMSHEHILLALNAFTQKHIILMNKNLEDNEWMNQHNAAIVYRRRNECLMQYRSTILSQTFTFILDVKSTQMKSRQNGITE